MEEMMKPAWLQGLMSENFFGGCEIHQNRRKNEKNIFCLECCQSFCPHCLPQHHSHPLLQVLFDSIHVISLKFRDSIMFLFIVTYNFTYFSNLF